MRDYIVGSFNIQHLNNTKDFEMLAIIIKQENFDVVAIQEARSKEAVERIAKNLNAIYWDSAYPKEGEEYAFIWKKRRLRLLEMPQNKENPRIENSFHYKKENGEVKLVRPPYVGYFTAKGMYGGCNFDLRLINTHIAFSKPFYAPEFVSERNVRRNELSVLVRELYDSVNTSPIFGVRSIFTALLGDFNLVLTGAGDNIIENVSGFDEKYPYKTQNGDGMKFRQEEKSSLKQAKDTTYNGLSNEDIAEQQEQELARDSDYYSRNYDHFAYGDSLTDRYGVQCSRVDAVYKYCNNDLALYRKKISDHVPIKMIITLK